MLICVSLLLLLFCGPSGGTPRGGWGMPSHRALADLRGLCYRLPWPRAASALVGSLCGGLWWTSSTQKACRGLRSLRHYLSACLVPVPQLLTLTSRLRRPCAPPTEAPAFISLHSSTTPFLQTLLPNAPYWISAVSQVTIAPRGACVCMRCC